MTTTTNALPKSEKLCPLCIKSVEFQPLKNPDGSITRQCPACGGDVPLLYERDYAKFPPALFSLIGFRSHGKSTFLGSLFHELDSAAMYGSPKEWPDFSYSALDQKGMEHVREMQRQLEDRELPAPTDHAFFKPAILRIKNMPRFGQCQLLAYDTSGEILQNVTMLKSVHTGYISRVPTVMLLVSWRQKDDAEKSPHHLDELLTIYRQALLDLGGDPRQQNLLVVLTKGDRLWDESTVPPILRHFLKPSSNGSTSQNTAALVSEDASDEHWDTLELVSEVTEAWLEQQRKFGNFVREASDEFRRVEYCIATATGSEPENGKLLCDLAPRGVLSAFLWILRLQRPDAKEESLHKKRIDGLTKFLCDRDCVEFFDQQKRGAERLRALKKLSTGRGRLLMAQKLAKDYRAANAIKD